MIEVKLSLSSAKRLLGTLFQYYYGLPKNKELLDHFYGLEVQDVAELHKICVELEKAIDSKESNA